MIRTDTSDLERMVYGYLSTAVWLATSGEESYHLTKALGHTSGEFTIDPDDMVKLLDLRTIVEAVHECYDFCTDLDDELAELDAEQVGHDFYLTRNGHGAGFWDRGLGEVGDRLSDAAKVYGETSIEILYEGRYYDA